MKLSVVWSDVESGGERVKINGMSTALHNSFQPTSSSSLTCHVNGVMPVKKRVAVLISGSGLLPSLLHLSTVGFHSLPVLFLPCDAP